MPNVVVIGAGVTGLTTALQLAKRGDCAVTVVAKHMPGDYDIEYTSPWAGANVMPMASGKDSEYERRTWPELKRICEEVPEAGIHFQECVILRRKKDLDALAASDSKLPTDLWAPDPWFSKMFEQYREMDPSELPEGVASGSAFTSVCINTALYLPWLVGQCRKRGVVFKRASLKHVREAAALSHAGAAAAAAGEVVVVNASGLLASRLGGVMDGKVVPARGQIVLVRNELSPMLTISATDDGEDELYYSMLRANGGGTVIGGTYMIGNWDPNPDPNIANRILQRCLQTHPAMKGKTMKDFDIIRHGVGLRPYRTGGLRLEKEKIEGTWVVHNYGHAGWGYQGSYGTAEGAVKIVDEIIKNDLPKTKSQPLSSKL